MRALPLRSMAQEPQISSRQFESYEMGVVFSPSRVTGFSAMSRRQMMTFIEGRHLRENSSQHAASFGPACRFTLTMTCFVSDIDPRPTPAKQRFYFTASYRRGRGLIKKVSTGSYASWISLLSHFARVVFSQLTSSRSGK